ncbi:MAG: hypothetical protein OHK0031_19200 [Anaerolineales bacterium]
MHAVLPPGYTCRAGTLSDYHLVFELANAAALRLNGRVDLTDPELIRLDWLNEGFQPENDVHLVFAADGTLAAMLETWLTSQPPVHPWNWTCVHPEHEGRGLREYLLSVGEARSRAALDLTEASLRVAPRTGTEHHNLPARASIEKMGWTYIRSFYRMETELSAPPQVPAAPAGITVRPYDPATELEAVYRCFVDSFRDHYGFVEQPFARGFAEFKHNLVDEPGYDPKFWFVAVDGGEIAGICLCRPVDAEDPESGWVNELGVRRAWRKRGLGEILLKTAFAAFYTRGQKRAGLGVDASSLTGALRLYERAGMHAARQFDNYEKELRPGLEISTQTV